MYRTVDGGAHWVRLPSVSSTAPVPFRHMRTVADVGTTFRDPSTGWVTLTERGAAALVATGDGGRSWQELRLPQPPVPWSSSDIVSTAPPAIFGREVLVAAYDTPTTQQFGDDRSWLYTSFDGGLTWQPPRPGPDGSPANPIASGATDIEVGQGELWAVQSTDILASYDGGSSWRSIAHEPEGVNPQDVIPAGARTAWCTGSRLGTNFVQRALLRTVDGGRTWHPVRPPPMA